MVVDVMIVVFVMLVVVCVACDHVGLLFAIIFIRVLIFDIFI